MRHFWMRKTLKPSGGMLLNKKCEQPQAREISPPGFRVSFVLSAPVGL